MSIISNAKEIAELVKKLGDIDLYKKIVELEGEIIELTREKHSVEEQNEELKRSLKISKEMTFQAPAYFAEEDRVPYCPKCWEIEKRAVHMITADKDPNNRQRYFECPSCRTGFSLGVRRYNLE